MKQITVAIAGLGSRGLDAYARYADEAPDEMKIVAVADILPDRVERAAKKYNVPADRCFASAEEMFEQEKLADAAFICTMDQDHYREAKAALLKGYDLLLEKPVSPSMDECRELAALAEKLGRKVIVGHVLRYTPFYRRLKAVLDEGTIGEVVSVQAIEKVCYWHQAHSFVRGNWRNSGTSSAMILQKCCHDMDILLWLTGKRCKTVSSFGSLTWFKPENAPEGATERCLDCPHKDDCLYSAPRFYLSRYDAGERDWPLNVLCQEPTREGLEEALRVGPYGRCVYHCDNNVVDHQVVNLLLEGGATISFMMCAFTAQGGREIHLMGTKGDIYGDLARRTIEIHPFGGEVRTLDLRTPGDAFGHGGGDEGIVRDLLSLLRGEEGDSTRMTTLTRSIESHLVCEAAEASRLRNGEAVEVK